MFTIFPLISGIISSDKINSGNIRVGQAQFISSNKSSDKITSEKISKKSGKLNTLLL